MNVVQMDTVSVRWTRKLRAIFAVLVAVAIASTGHFAGDLIHYGAAWPIAWIAALGIEVGIAVAMWTVLERRAEGRHAGWVIFAVLAMSALSMLANGHHALVQAAETLGTALSMPVQVHVVLLWASLPLLNVLLASIADAELEHHGADQRDTQEQIEQAVAQQTSAIERRLSTEHKHAVTSLRADHEQQTVARSTAHEQAIHALSAAHEQALAASRADHRAQVSMLMENAGKTRAQQSNGRVSSPRRQQVSAEVLLSDIAEQPMSTDADRAQRLACSRASVQRLRSALVDEGQIHQDDNGAWHEVTS